MHGFEVDSLPLALSKCSQEKLEEGEWRRRQALEQRKAQQRLGRGPAAAVEEAQERRKLLEVSWRGGGLGAGGEAAGGEAVGAGGREGAALGGGLGTRESMGLAWPGHGACDGGTPMNARAFMPLRVHAIRTHVFIPSVH